MQIKNVESNVGSLLKLLRYELWTEKWFCKVEKDVLLKMRNSFLSLHEEKLEFN